MDQLYNPGSLPPDPIIHYVGFQTELDPEAFWYIWKPIALQFKNRGIHAIEIYRTVDDDRITFLTRNLWSREGFFRTFEQGMPGSGQMGPIAIHGLGAFFLPEERLTPPDSFRLHLLRSLYFVGDPALTSGQTVASQAPFVQALEVPLEYEEDLPEAELVFECLGWRSL